MKKFIVKVLCLLVICLIPIEVHAMKVGFVADIHAGKEKVRNRVREGNGNIVFPKFYKLWLTRVFIWMKNDGADLVISLGDNVNTGKSSDAKDLAKFVKKKKVDVKWAKGNHDSDKSFRALSRQKYYSFDKEGWRFIIMDSSEVENDGQGGISDAQLNWVKSMLQTEQKVLVVIHHPIFGKALSEEPLGQFVELEKALSSAGNVKYVLSGHVHINEWERQANGIQYYGLTAMTLKGKEGRYKVLELN